MRILTDASRALAARAAQRGAAGDSARARGVAWAADWARVTGLTLAAGLLLWLAVGGLPNFDTASALSWGDALAHGRSPDVGALASPTAHPLTTLLGIVLAPFGGAAAPLTVLLCLTALAALLAIVGRLGNAWFGPPAGGLAALILISRPELISFAARAYMDVPYLALVLGALLVETRRPRAGTPVVALLAAAGLLRPEAWLLAAVYLAWLRRAGALRPALVALAASPPAIWAAMDLALTGDPLHSLHGTRAATVALARVTGPEALITALPGRTAALLGPWLLAALAGGAAFLLARRRSHTPALLAAALAASLAGSAVVALAGLPIVMRSVLLPATLLVLLGSGGIAEAVRTAAHVVRDAAMTRAAGDAPAVPRRPCSPRAGVARTPAQWRPLPILAATVLCALVAAQLPGSARELAATRAALGAQSLANCPGLVRDGLCLARRGAADRHRIAAAIDARAALVATPPRR